MRQAQQDMPIYQRTPGIRSQATMIPAASLNAATPSPPPPPPPPPPVPAIQVPNAPPAPSLAQGSGSDLAVTWATPAVDSAHSAATGFNLQFSPSGANTWTAASNVTSPYELSGLTAGAAYDVQVQGVNMAGGSVWSASSTRPPPPALPLRMSHRSAPSRRRRTERPASSLSPGRRRRSTALTLSQPVQPAL